MDINDYTIDVLVSQKLRESRAFAARQAQVCAARAARAVRRRAPRSTLRARLGIALIALGERLAGAPYPARGVSHG